MKNRFLRRALAALDSHPVLTVAMLRLVFLLSGPVNAALAMSRVRYSQYLLGTAVGMLPAMCFFSLTMSCWVQ